MSLFRFQKVESRQCGLSTAAGRTPLQRILADVAAIAGGDAGALGRGVPPAAVGAAEGGHGGVAAAVHDLLERQVGVAQQVARHLHVPVHAQLGEGQARELLDSGRELRVRMAAMAGGFCAQGTRGAFVRKALAISPSTTVSSTLMPVSCRAGSIGTIL